MISGGDLVVFLIAVFIVIVFFVILRRFVDPPDSDGGSGNQERSGTRPH
jgi:hypothetical protein